MSVLVEKASQLLRSAEERYAARNPQSKAQHERAMASLPGGNTRSVVYTSPFPIYITSGHGNKLIDVDGHEYTDYLGEMTAGLYGHSHPIITETITSVMQTTGLSLGASIPAETVFAEALTKRFPSLEHLRFTNSGTEANLYALSVARHVTGRSKIIVFEGAHHGGLLSFVHGVASNNVHKEDWILARYNDPEGTAKLITENKDVAAAVFVEAMQGAAGCIPGTAEFLHAIATAARENGILFILDEVVTSRLAPAGLQSVVLHPETGAPLRPDLTTMGKWIGGGLGIGVFGGRKDLMAVYDPRGSSIQHSGTFNNNTLVMNDLQDVCQGTNMAVTGIGAVMNIHFLPHDVLDGAQIRRIDDVDVQPGSVEAILRDLLWFYLIERKIWIVRRGIISLILGTTSEELDKLVIAIRGFVEEYREFLAV